MWGSVLGLSLNAIVDIGQYCYLIAFGKCLFFVLLLWVGRWIDGGYGCGYSGEREDKKHENSKVFEVPFLQNSESQQVVGWILKKSFTFFCIEELLNIFVPSCYLPLSVSYPKPFATKATLYNLN